MRPLEGKVAVVAGATRGAGRGIACALGEAGATVYCTGRSVRGRPATGNRPETIEETAERVTARGGRGIAVQVDHTDPEQVRELFRQVEAEQGRLDVLVNDIWGGDALTEWGKPFWEHSLESGLRMQERAVHTHLITAHFGAPLMVAHGRGLIVEVTDGDTLDYRGSLFYDLAKTSVIRLALSMARDLRPHGVTALAVTPGFLRSEEVLEHFGVTEASWRDAVAKDPFFAESETPFFVGRAVAALAADPALWKKSGGVYASWNLAEEYGFDDVDGRRPHWGRFFRGKLDERWAGVVERVREEIRGEGDDPDATVEADRETLTLRLRADEGEVPVALSPTELFLADPGTVAGEALRLRERAGKPRPAQNTSVTS